MTAFDLLLQEAKTAASASVSELVGLQMGDAAMTVSDAAYHAVDGLMPDPDKVDPFWITGMLRDRPNLLAMESVPGSVADVIVGAVRDLILDEIEGDVLDFARNVGIDIPMSMKP